MCEFEPNLHLQETVRNPKPTQRVSHSDEQIRAAVQAVIDRKLSLRTVAEDYGITKSTLSRYVMKAKGAIVQGEATALVIHQPKFNHAKVFDDEQERSLSEYLLTASKMHAGMTRKMLMEFAYEYAKINRPTYPTTWDTNKQAGLSPHPVLLYNFAPCFNHDKLL